MSEDDSSPKRKKKPKLRLMSESESEEEGEPVRTRKHLRVVSEDESSDSSVPGARRSRMLPQLRDYHDESGSSEWESDHSDEDQPPDPSQPIKTTGCASDSSEGNSDKCPICLLRFSEQMVGIPENCEHLFCVDCITEWSKNVNTCPVDRITFSKIVVRACAGGRVLHTRDVETKDQNVLNIEDMFADDITRCQICESSDDGASMLLCDVCDQGFHMQCMTPPMNEIPEGDWYCPTCAPRITIDLDTSNMFMERLEARFGRTRGSRSQIQTEPSTSAGGSSTGTSNRRVRRKTTSTGRRKIRRRTKTVITEYEIQDGNKFPVKRKVPIKRRVKKRKIKKRAPRTAARRSLVRASVRERLVSLRSQLSQLNSTSEGVQELSVTRHRAGIPTLNLFGNRNQLEYFSEDEQDESGSGSVAVALRPTSSVLSAYRQARRKMILIPSPPHASSAPDLLSNIMESQTLLHSKKSLVSITVDGKVNIKLQGSSSGKNPIKISSKSDDKRNRKDDKVDLTTGEDSTKKAPSYPGQSRGGGWDSGTGGGYRGGYQNREQGNNNNNRTGSNYGPNNGSYGGGNNYGGNYRGGGGGGFQGNQDGSYHNANTWQGDSEPNFPERRRDQLEEEDDNRNLQRQNLTMREETYNNMHNMHRHNLPPLMENDSYNRPNVQNPPPLLENNFNRHNVQRHIPPSLEETPYSRNNMQRLIPPLADDDLYNRPNQQRPPPPVIGGGSGLYTRSLSDQGRQSLAPSWQPYQSDTPRMPEQSTRHSFGGFEQGMDALDMRVGQNEPTEGPLDVYGDIQHPQENSPPQHYEPLPEPPVFRFEKPADDEEDESLVIDTEKYDPTEPTLDESSGEEDGTERKPFKQTFPETQPHAPYVPQFSRDPDAPFGPQLPLDRVPSSPLKVPPTLLDKAVQQVLNEHRNLIAPTHVNRSIVDYKSDEESEGDCPNFSIYSATSVNIANSSGASVIPRSAKPPENDFLEKEEDLVQEDDDVLVPEEHSTIETITEKADSCQEPEPIEEETLSAKEKAAQDEFKERLSRRCPITPNKRNPIKIKLNNTPTLIKRHVLDLYADEDEEEPLEETKNVSKKCKVSTTTEKQDLKAGSPTENQGDEPKIPMSQEVSSSILSSPTHETECTESEIANTELYENNDVSKHDTKSKTISDNEENTVMESEKSPQENNSEGDNDLTDDDKTPPQKRSDSSEILPDTLGKMTESVSESEDERSYTPCLDENKSKDTSLENEKENVGIEGLDTEMISEEEGNEMFSDGDEQKDESDHEGSQTSLPKEFAPGEEEGEIIEKRKEFENKDEDEEGEKDEGEKEEGKKKKRKEKKLTSKPKGKTKKSDITFKKLSKSGRERNYRDKEEKGKTKSKDRKKSDDKESREKAKEKRREKRKDMERYDVRNIVSEKRRRVKDAFGRDSSRPRSKSPSVPPSLSPPMRSLSHARRSISLTGLRRSLSRGARSRSRRSLSKSKERYTPSIRRSVSRGRKSFTPLRHPISPRLRTLISPRGRSPLSPLIRRSMSPRIRFSISPQMRRSISPRIRRSISPRLRRSISPQIRILRRSIPRAILRTMSPRLRRSLSPRPRRSISPRGRRSVSHRKRKSVSPKARRKNRHSMSPRKRSISPRRRSSLSRGRKRVRRSISKSPKAKKSPRKKSRRSRSRIRSLSRNRSRTPKLKKIRRTKARKSRSPKRKSPKSKKRPVVMRSITPELMLSPERIRERVPPVWRNDKAMYQEWSDSRSMNSRMLSPSWTPPREPSPDRRHLRVFLENKDKINRKEKKKRQREAERRPRQLRRGPDAGPSKEVFTSGNNILVSVSFNKDDIAETQDPIVTDLGSKKRKRKGESKKDRKERLKKRRLERKNKELENKKPVAIIDLEKSPFRELTPSPKNVIILSDSDHGEKEDEMNQRQQVLRNELREAPIVQEVVNAPHREQAFTNSVGPKTPPEPSVKFSIMPKTNTQLRAVNPLDEEEEGEHHDEPENEENDIDNHMDGTHKGPNTPPDPPNTPPSSPDAYDPFEPTKSGSATPEQDPGQNGDENADPQEKATITLETAQKTNLSADDVVNQRPITPIEKVMALLQSTRNVSPTNVTDDMSTVQPMENELGSGTGTSVNAGQSPDRTNTVAKTVPPQSHFSVSVAPTVSSSAPIYLSTGIPRIGAFSNAPSPRANSNIQISLNQRIVLPSPTKSSPLKMQPAKLFLAKPSPIKSTPIKPMPSKTLISKLPLPSVKPIPGRKKNIRTTDVIDLDMDMDSPYSPGSSDFGDLFEPPTDSKYQKSGKSDIFDTLFGSKQKKSKSSATKVPVKHIRKKGNKTQVGVRIDDDNLKILDDLPSSAVEMQVKSKFLKKLNRQERVVEEVKLVLKPHYNKKHVTKEQYKDILRRTVPKICHNKTGEINPSKIQALVEAYVHKYRKKNKNAA